MTMGNGFIHPAHLYGIRNPKIKFWIKIISVLIGVIFIFPSISWAFETSNYPAKPNEIVFNGHSIRVPNQFGSITHVLPGQEQLVIHIQDLHCHFEVQSRIADFLDWLATHHGLKFVGIEGASLPINVTKLSTFPDEDIKQGVGRWLMQRGRMAGTEYFAATSKRQVILEGMENPEHYADNRTCIRQFLNDETQGHLYDLRESLAALKPHIYSSALMKFDRQVSAFKQGQATLLEHTSFLAQEAQKHGLTLNPFRTIQRYLQSGSNLQDLDYDALLDELDKLETAIREIFYTSSSQRELDECLQRVLLMEKLLNISATPEDVSTYRAHPENYCLAFFQTFLNRHAANQHGIEVDPSMALLDQKMKAVERFYTVADQRSQDLVENLLHAMQQHHQSLAVLTTGGYHTDHIQSILAQRGIGFISFKPKLTQWDAVNPYFNLLRQQRTPLEKLLAQNQEKLALEPYLMAWQDALKILDESLLPNDKQVDYHVVQLALVLWKLHKLGDQGILNSDALNTLNRFLQNRYSAYNQAAAFLRDVVYQGRDSLVITLPDSLGPYVAAIYPQKHQSRLPSNQATPFMSWAGYEAVLYPIVMQKPVAQTLERLDKQVTLTAALQPLRTWLQKALTAIVSWPAQVRQSLSQPGFVLGILPGFRSWVVDSDTGQIHWGRALMALVAETLILAGLAVVAINGLTTDWPQILTQSAWKTVLEIGAPALAMTLLHLGQVVVYRNGKYIKEKMRLPHFISLLFLHVLLAGCVVGGAMLGGAGLLGIGVAAAGLSGLLGISLVAAGIALGMILGGLVAYGVHWAWNRWIVRISPNIAAGLIVPGISPDQNMPSEEFIRPGSPLRSHTVVSLQFEAGLDRGLLVQLEKWLGRIMPRFIAQLTMSGGLGALMPDLIDGWKKNGTDVVAIHPLYTTTPKGVVRGMPKLPEGKSLGDFLRDPRIMEKTDMGFTMNLDWEGFNAESDKAKAIEGQEIHVEVYHRKSKFSKAPLYYLDAYYVKDGKKVYIFDEMYPDNDYRDVHMAVYNEASQRLVKLMQERGLIKPNVLFVENEVFVSLPKNHFPNAKRHHINHTVWKPGIYRPKEKSFKLLGFNKAEHDMIVRDGHIAVDEYIALHADVITGVGIYEHTPVLENEVFPMYRNKIEYYNHGGLRNTNGALLDLWQGEEFRTLINQFKQKLDINLLDSDEALFVGLQLEGNEGLLQLFQSRMETIKAYYSLQLLQWLQENQTQEMGGGSWLKATLDKAGIQPDQFQDIMQQYGRMLQAAQNQETVWQEIDNQLGSLRDAVLANPIASNVRRIVAYKGPDKYKELLKQMKDWDKQAVERFIKSGTRLIIGGREFDDKAKALFDELKQMAKELGLEGQIAFIENYNIDEAPMIFKGVCATIMLSDEFLEASATSMMKAITDGALLIGVWGGAMPELFHIIDTKTGQTIDVLETKITHDELREGLKTGKYKITNGFLVLYADHEKSAEEMGGRRPSVASLLDGIARFGEEFQSQSKRQGLLFQALATSPRVDVERGQARAHIRMWEDIIQRHQQREEFLIRNSGLSAQHRNHVLDELGQPFPWQYLPYPTSPDEKRTLDEGGRGLRGFIKSFQRVRAKGKEGEWSLRYHVFRNEIFQYLEEVLSGDSALKPIADQIAAMKTQCENTTNFLEKLRLTLAALNLLEQYVLQLEKSEEVSQHAQAMLSEIDFFELDHLVNEPIGRFVWHDVGTKHEIEASPMPSLAGLCQQFQRYLAGDPAELDAILAHHSWQGNRFTENPAYAGGDLVKYLADTVGMLELSNPKITQTLAAILTDFRQRIQYAREAGDQASVLEISKEFMAMVQTWVSSYEARRLALLQKGSGPSAAGESGQVGPIMNLVPSAILPFFRSWVLNTETGQIRWGRALLVLLGETLMLIGVVLVTMKGLTTDWTQLFSQSGWKTALEIGAPALAMTLLHLGQVVVYREGKYTPENMRWPHFVSLLILHLLLAGCVVGGAMLGGAGLLGLGAATAGIAGLLGISLLAAGIVLGVVLGGLAAYAVHWAWNRWLVRLSPNIAAGMVIPGAEDIELLAAQFVQIAAEEGLDSPAMQMLFQKVIRLSPAARRRIYLACAHAAPMDAVQVFDQFHIEALPDLQAQIMEFMHDGNNVLTGIIGTLNLYQFAKSSSEVFNSYLPALQENTKKLLQTHSRMQSAFSFATQSTYKDFQNLMKTDPLIAQTNQAHYFGKWLGKSDFSAIEQRELDLLMSRTLPLDEEKVLQRRNLQQGMLLLALEDTIAQIRYLLALHGQILQFMDLLEVQKNPALFDMIQTNFLDLSFYYDLLTSGQEGQALDLRWLALLTQSQFATRGVIVEWEPGFMDHPQRVFGNYGQILVSIFKNIIDNADYAINEMLADKPETQKKEFKREIVLHFGPNSVRCHDNGPGIPANLIEPIRARGFTTRLERGGSGLGVYSADQTIQSFGGKLEIGNRINPETNAVQGAELTFTFLPTERGAMGTQKFVEEILQAKYEPEIKQIQSMSAMRDQRKPRVGELRAYPLRFGLAVVGWVVAVVSALAMYSNSLVNNGWFWGSVVLAGLMLALNYVPRLLYRHWLAQTPPVVLTAENVNDNRQLKYIIADINRRGGLPQSVDPLTVQFHVVSSPTPAARWWGRLRQAWQGTQLGQGRMGQRGPEIGVPAHFFSWPRVLQYAHLKHELTEAFKQNHTSATRAEFITWAREPWDISGYGVDTGMEQNPPLFTVAEEELNLAETLHSGTQSQAIQADFFGSCIYVKDKRMEELDPAMQFVHQSMIRRRAQQYQAMEGLTYQGHGVAPRFHALVRNAQGHIGGYLCEPARGERLGDLAMAGVITPEQLQEAIRQIREQLQIMADRGFYHGGVHRFNILVEFPDDDGSALDKNPWRARRGQPVARLIDSEVPDSEYELARDLKHLEFTQRLCLESLRPENVAYYRNEHALVQAPAGQRPSSVVVNMAPQPVDAQGYYGMQAARNLEKVLDALGVPPNAVVLNLGSGKNPLKSSRYRIVNVDQSVEGEDHVVHGEEILIANLFDEGFNQTVQEYLGSSKASVLVFFNLWAYMGLYGPYKARNVDEMMVAQRNNFPHYFQRALEVMQPNGQIVFIQYMPPELLEQERTSHGLYKSQSVVNTIRSQLDLPWIDQASILECPIGNKGQSIAFGLAFHAQPLQTPLETIARRWQEIPAPSSRGVGILNLTHPQELPGALDELIRRRIPSDQWVAVRMVQTMPETNTIRVFIFGDTLANLIRAESDIASGQGAKDSWAQMVMECDIQPFAGAHGRVQIQMASWAEPSQTRGAELINDLHNTLARILPQADVRVVATQPALWHTLMRDFDAEILWNPDSPADLEKALRGLGIVSTQSAPGASWQELQAALHLAKSSSPSTADLSDSAFLYQQYNELAAHLSQTLSTPQPTTSFLAEELLPIAATGGVSKDELSAWLFDRIFSSRVILAGQIPGALAAPQSTYHLSLTTPGGTTVSLTPDEYLSGVNQEIFSKAVIQGKNFKTQVLDAGRFSEFWQSIVTARQLMADDFEQAWEAQSHVLVPMSNAADSTVALNREEVRQGIEAGELLWEAGPNFTVAVVGITPEEYGRQIEDQRAQMAEEVQIYWAGQPEQQPAQMVQSDTPGPMEVLDAVIPDVQVDLAIRQGFLRRLRQESGLFLQPVGMTWEYLRDRMFLSAWNIRPKNATKENQGGYIRISLLRWVANFAVLAAIAAAVLIFGPSALIASKPLWGGIIGLGLTLALIFFPRLAYRIWLAKKPAVVLTETNILGNRRLKNLLDSLRHDDGIPPELDTSNVTFTLLGAQPATTRWERIRQAWRGIPLERGLPGAKGPVVALHPHFLGLPHEVQRAVLVHAIVEAYGRQRWRDHLRASWHEYLFLLKQWVFKPGVKYIGQDDFQILMRTGRGSTANIYKAKYHGRNCVFVRHQELDEYDPKYYWQLPEDRTHLAQPTPKDVKYYKKMNTLYYQGRRLTPEILAVVKNEAGQVVGYLTESIPGTTLDEATRLGIITHEELETVVADIREQLKSLHQRGFVHGDLHPSQIIITNLSRSKAFRHVPLEARLVDFGFRRSNWNPQNDLNDLESKVIQRCRKDLEPERVHQQRTLRIQAIQERRRHREYLSQNDNSINNFVDAFHQLYQVVLGHDHALAQSLREMMFPLMQIVVMQKNHSSWRLSDFLSARYRMETQYSRITEPLQNLFKNPDLPPEVQTAYGNFMTNFKAFKSRWEYYYHFTQLRGDHKGLKALPATTGSAPGLAKPALGKAGKISAQPFRFIIGFILIGVSAFSTMAIFPVWIVLVPNLALGLWAAVTLLAMNYLPRLVYQSLLATRTAPEMLRADTINQNSYLRNLLYQLEAQRALPDGIRPSAVRFTLLATPQKPKTWLDFIRQLWSGQDLATGIMNEGTPEISLPKNFMALPFIVQLAVLKHEIREAVYHGRWWAHWRGQWKEYWTYVRAIPRLKRAFQIQLARQENIDSQTASPSESVLFDKMDPVEAMARMTLQTGELAVFAFRNEQVQLSQTANRPYRPPANWAQNLIQAILFSSLQLHCILVVGMRWLRYLGLVAWALFDQLFSKPIQLTEADKIRLRDAVQANALEGREAAAFARRYGMPLQPLEPLPLSQYPGGFFRRLWLLFRLGGIGPKAGQPETQSLYIPDVFLRTSVRSNTLLAPAINFLQDSLIQRQSTQHRLNIRRKWVLMRQWLSLTRALPHPVLAQPLHQVAQRLDADQYLFEQLETIPSSPLTSLLRDEKTQIHRNYARWIRQPSERNARRFYHDAIMNVLLQQSQTLRRLRSENGDPLLIQALESAHISSIQSLSEFARQNLNLHGLPMGQWVQGDLFIPDITLDYHTRGALADILQILPGIQINHPALKSPPRFIHRLEQAI